MNNGKIHCFTGIRSVKLYIIYDNMICDVAICDKIGVKNMIYWKQNYNFFIIIFLHTSLPYLYTATKVSFMVQSNAVTITWLPSISLSFLLALSLTDWKYVSFNAVFQTNRSRKNPDLANNDARAQESASSLKIVSQAGQCGWLKCGFFFLTLSP